MGGLAVLAVPVQAELADGVKAIVNDTVITVAQVDDFTQPVIETLRRQYAGQPEAYAKAVNDAVGDSLEQLVERQLILHSFDKEGYKLPDSVIDDVIQDRIRERFGDRVTMVKTLQAQGMTVEQFRKDVRDQYIEAAMRNQNVSREIIISPFKVQNYYQAHQSDYQVADQVRLRMITLNKNGVDSASTLARANDILAQLHQGTPFADLARQYSQDAQQRQGGDRGWVDHTTLRKELADAAFALKAGETSTVIDLPEACYLLHVEEVRRAHVKPLEEVRAGIEKTLRTDEQNRLQKQWIDSLKRKTFYRFF